MPEKSIVFPRGGNPYWPLPADYYSGGYTEEGKRLLRVNACRLGWAENDPKLHVAAWEFFRNWYLKTLPLGVWYKPPLYPSPPCHYAYVHDIHKYARNVQIFPRSFGKTMLMRENVLRWIYTMPFFKILMIKSRDDFVKEDFTRIQYVMEQSAALNDDFGNLKPKKGDGVWSKNRMFLANGVECVGRAVTSQVLGFRPNVWICDDVETDNVMRAEATNLRENLKNLIFQHLEPMLDEGCTGVMQGTLLTRKTLLYEMATADPKEEPRWNYWNRTILQARNLDGSLTWPEKFSEERLRERKSALGSAAFSAQFLNDPGSSEDRMLELDSTYGYYSVDEQDDAYTNNPLVSNSELVSWIPRSTKDGYETEEIRRPLGETVQNMTRVVLVDYAPTATMTSDFNAVVVVGFERGRPHRDTMWILDCWQGKPRGSAGDQSRMVDESKLLDIIWHYAEKWRAQVVGIESVALQQRFTDKACADFLHRGIHKGWSPEVFPIKYAGDSRKLKGLRIAGLSWRFEQDRIKFPKHLRTQPDFKELLFQIDNATVDLNLLRHDDLVDALAMFQYVIRPAGKYTERKAEVLETDLELLRKGIDRHPVYGYKLSDALNSSEIPFEVAAEFAARKRGRHRTRQTIIRAGRC